MKNSEKLTWTLLGAIIAGLAAEWFISGSYHSHSQIRNIFTAIQLVIGLGMILYPFLKK